MLSYVYILRRISRWITKRRVGIRTGKGIFERIRGYPGRDYGLYFPLNAAVRTRKPDEEEDADERSEKGGGGNSDLFRFDLTATPCANTQGERRVCIWCIQAGARGALFSVSLTNFEQPICWEVCKISEETIHRLYRHSRSEKSLARIFLRPALFICITKSLYKVRSFLFL